MKAKRVNRTTRQSVTPGGVWCDVITCNWMSEAHTPEGAASAAVKHTRDTGHCTHVRTVRITSYEVDHL